MDERGGDARAARLGAATSRRTLLTVLAATAASGVLRPTLRQSGGQVLAARPASEEGTTMTTVRTDDGVTLAYRVRGDGPISLLFMHGWAGSGAYFDETLSRLDLTGLRAITYDFRGHGASDKTETGYDLERFAADALTVADAAGADRIVPIGYSMSGKFAQYLALVAPDRVAGQILVAGWPAAATPLPPETLEDWVGRAGDRERLLELERMFITRPVAPEVLERWADDAVKVSRLVLDETLRMTVEPAFADRLGELRASTLVVGGLHDPVATPAFLRDGVVAPLEAIGARLALLDCNHDVPIEQPQEFAGLIEAFIAALS